ncbi:FdhF/YdeP family oxidoreductase [Auraticoccus monumenti]|uniref:Formate dehydrogenase major subunit n=1 Tax=Auraticoccus monumenti TaxID=675864 RepID=A0A1G6YE38_9ACTN|nr:FdhF/YdeP family oxidoreductase [Auraticoccus monumenti]SDD88628.1 formate dehydrogenase major subunit [Auraticoccus monumenti]
MDASTTDGPDPREPGLEVHEPKSAAAGVTAVAVSVRRSLKAMGVKRTAQTLLKLNHADGFDCMSCAWPDPDPEHRHTAEFCENGAKAVAEEATTDRLTPAFFARHSIAELDTHDELWLGHQGRITHPVVKRPGGTHYEPIDWADAYRLIADTLNGLESPDEAAFYTSGRASNEAAFAYQLFVRALGTNNLPDCSNMCHESTSVALVETIGIGKGSISLNDVYHAKCIVIAGQNPGTNHPRMLQALETAKLRGAKIIAINPLREAGLVNFRNPQKPRGVIGKGIDIADLHLPVRVNGDLALFQGIGSLLVEWDAVDHEFMATHTRGYEAWAEHVRQVDWSRIEEITGLTRAQITEAAEMIRDSDATVWCWAMGLTQHRNAVATIKEVTNLALVRGDIGKKGAGLCPVRGHSNVQGDRTMGIWERSPDTFLDALHDEFGFEPPREHGLDTVRTIQGMRDGTVKVFMGLGGNFVHAAPDTEVTLEAMRRTRLTVQVSTKLNRSHLACGETALILPTKGRTEKDVHDGIEQFVTVEDSMSSVHASRGVLEPASPFLRSEVQIVTGIARATLGDRHAGIDWAAMGRDYSVIRRHIANVVPGCADYEARVDRPGGFTMPHPPRDSRTFTTESGLGEISVSPMDVVQVPEGHLVLQTLRSHDQFNTTIYGLSDRYRGVEGGRRVIFLHPDDLTMFGLSDGDMVDITSVWDDDRDRTVRGFRCIAYETPRGCAAAYYPETNPLVPLDSTAEASNCPTSKSVIITLSRPGEPEGSSSSTTTSGSSNISEDTGGRHPQPLHQS